MVSNRLGDKKGTNLSNVVRFNEAMKTQKYAIIKFECKPIPIAQLLLLFCGGVETKSRFLDRLFSISLRPSLCQCREPIQVGCSTIVSSTIQKARKVS
jgi:hypothetical protein